MQSVPNSCHTPQKPSPPLFSQWSFCGVGARKGVDFESMKYSTIPAPNSLALQQSTGSTSLRLHNSFQTFSNWLCQSPDYLGLQDFHISHLNQASSPSGPVAVPASISGAAYPTVPTSVCCGDIPSPKLVPSVQQQDACRVCSILLVWTHGLDQKKIQKAQKNTKDRKSQKLFHIIPWCKPSSCTFQLIFVCRKTCNAKVLWAPFCTTISSRRIRNSFCLRKAKFSEGVDLFELNTTNQLSTRESMSQVMKKRELHRLLPDGMRRYQKSARSFLLVTTLVLIILYPYVHCPFLSF